MKRIVKFEVSVSMEYPKSWSKDKIDGLAREIIGNSRIGGGGADGMYSAEVKKMRQIAKS